MSESARLKMGNREEFEKWAQENFLVFDLEFVEICYAVIETEYAWEAWQARQPEIDALKEELAIRVNSESRAWSKIDALKAEVDRLRKDAERLDMLDLPSIDLRTNDDQEDEERFAVFKVTGYPNDREWSVLGLGKTVRDAIDAAMKETK